MKKLSELREEIDSIDTKIVELLKARAELVLGVRETKQATHTSIYSPAREQEIIQRVTELAKSGNFPQPSLEKIFRAIISATRSLVGDLVVAYVGPEDSMANQAAFAQFGEEVTYFPATTVNDVFRRVQNGEVSHGVVPVESASGGTNTATYDELIDAQVNIVAEIELVGRLLLVAEKGALSGAEKIYSDIASFTRCQNWLKSNLPKAELIVVDNSAIAAKLAHQTKNSAAVVGGRVQEESKLSVLANGIEDQSGSAARFFVLGGEVPPATGNDRTSLLVAVKEKPGALSEVLEPFSKSELTLTKIESRPMKNRAGEFAFFIDILGHKSDAKVISTVEKLTSLSTYLKILGSYPVARRVN